MPILVMDDGTCTDSDTLSRARGVSDQPSLSSIRRVLFSLSTLGLARAWPLTYFSDVQAPQPSLFCPCGALSYMYKPKLPLE